MGANGGSHRVPGAKKLVFSKVVSRPLRMLKQVFVARLELMVTCFGPWNVPKWVENRLFWDQKWVEKGQKRVIPNIIVDHLGCSNKCLFFVARVQPVGTPFGRPEIPKCFENGPFWDQNGGVKNGSKTHFSISDHEPFVVHKQVK